jgi:hypothetical protein
MPVKSQDEVDQVLRCRPVSLRALWEEGLRQLEAGDVISHEDFWKHLEPEKPRPRRTKKA